MDIWMDGYMDRWIAPGAFSEDDLCLSLPTTTIPWQLAMALAFLFLPLPSSSISTSTTSYYVRPVSSVDNNFFAFRLNVARNQVPLVLGHASDDSPKARLEHTDKSSNHGYVWKKLEVLITASLILGQIAPAIPSRDFASVAPANAVLYSPDTKVPRTGELALRRAIPANTNMKAIQDSLEEISYLLRIPQRKPYGTMEGNVKKALKIAKDGKDAILASIPPNLREKGSVLYASMTEGKGGLQQLLKWIDEKEPDKVSVGLASALDTVAQLELLQAPGLSFLLPQQYQKYPRLTGRAIVELTIEKGDGTAFSPETGGEPRKTASMQMVVDGYSAPLTAGNFAKMVVDGAYDGTKLTCVNQAVLSDNGVNKNLGYKVPLEIMPSGQFEPLYRTALSVQDGELPVLPLSVYGAVAMAHSEDSDEYSSPYQFFFYLYDKRNSGLGGVSFDEGQFSVFGYTTAGKELLSQIKTGDIIRSAKLVEGQDRLVLPSDS